MMDWIYDSFMKGFAKSIAFLAIGLFILTIIKLYEFIFDKTKRQHAIKNAKEYKNPTYFAFGLSVILVLYFIFK